MFFFFFSCLQRRWKSTSPWGACFDLSTTRLNQFFLCSLNYWCPIVIDKNPSVIVLMSINWGYDHTQYSTTDTLATENKTDNSLTVCLQDVLQSLFDEYYLLRLSFGRFTASTKTENINSWWRIFSGLLLNLKGSQRMNLTDSSDALTFHLAPPSGHDSNLSNYTLWPNAENIMTSSSASADRFCDQFKTWYMHVSYYLWSCCYVSVSSILKTQAHLILCCYVEVLCVLLQQLLQV